MRLHLRCLPTISALVLMVVWPAFSQAQIDPSSALLLNNLPPTNSQTPVPSTKFDSGRYTVKPKAEVRSSKRVEAADADDDSPPAPAPSPSPAGAQVGPPLAPGMVQSSSPAPSPSASAPLSAGNSGAAQVVAKPEVKVDQATPQASQAPTPVSTHSGETGAAPIENSRNANAVSDDRRLQLLEIGVGSGYLYNDSQSSYSFRNYSTSSPLLSVDGRVWISPAFAIQSSFLGTLSGDLSDSYDDHKNTTASQQWFNTGIRTRKFFGTGRRSPSLELGLDYSEYTLQVPANAVLRESLESSGFRLSLDAMIPTSDYCAWTLSFELLPKLQHSEEATAVTFSSGGNVDANAVGISFGQRLGFDRSNAMYWKISYRIEKDLFSGPASQSDPLTGQIPSDVAVTNSWAIFEFGYRWGD